MKLLVDFIPIVVFFAVFKWQGIFAATAAAIAAVAVHVLILLILRRKISPLLWLNLGLIVIFGGATIIFRNEWFIKLKPTILYLIIAAVFFVSERFFGKNIFKILSGQNVVLSDEVWKFLANSWMAFFVVLGALNLIVAYLAPTDIWVNFKLFGLLGLTLVFAVGQGIYLSRRIQGPTLP